MKHLFLTHLKQLEHGNETHPENSARLQAILDEFATSPYKNLLNLSVDRQATLDELTKVHEKNYVDHVLSLEGQTANLDHETILSKGSVNAALLAAGQGLELVEQVVEGQVQNGFVLVRPPGHHARPACGMGFCVFNNIAIAAKKALSMGIKRILILDWDVHHGNGTQEAFYESDNVLFIDIHQDSLFPVPSGLLQEKGQGKGLGFTVNIPLPPSCHNEDYLYVFDQLVEPLARQYQPELILVSAGFDAHESDPMGFMNLTTQAYGLLTAKTKQLAEEVCKGKLVLFLEGGYNPFFLAKNVMECVRVLVGESISNDLEKLSPSKKVETLVKEIYESYFR